MHCRKKVYCWSPADCNSLAHRVGLHWTGRENKEKHIPIYTWEGWVMESCPHVLFSKALFQVQSEWPTCIGQELARDRKKKRERAAWHRCYTQQSGWTTFLTLEFQSQRCSLCVLLDINLQKAAAMTGNRIWRVTHQQILILPNISLGCKWYSAKNSCRFQ